MKAETGLPPVNPLPAPPVPASPSGKTPTGWHLWWQAIRPRTLTISVAPVIAGSALAYGDAKTLDTLIVLAALLGALAIQSGTNLYNDVADYLKGGDQPLRQGPARVTAMGWATPSQVKRAALVSFLLAALCGFFLIFKGGLPILLLGLFSLLAGWAYSLGPKPIAYTPLGEVFVVAFFGLGAVGGSYYLQTQTLSWQALSIGLAVGLIAAGVLMANNYRDMEPDRLAGRHTLAIVSGPAASKLLYALFILVPLALAIPPWGASGGWLCLALLPAAYRLLRLFATLARGPAFNGILANTARYQLAFSVLVALGILL